MNYLKVKFYKFIGWFANAKNFHQRMMMRYLRKRNWVVFYLEPQVRECKDGFCWMKLYKTAQNDGKHFITT